MTGKVEAVVLEQKEQYVPLQLYPLDIKSLNPDPTQPRKSFDQSELISLAESIKKYGVLQPILFRQAEDGTRIIVAGERRYRATKLAKLDTIPAIFTEGNATEIALIENLLRVDLTPLEQAESLQRLQNESKCSSKALAAVIGKSESTTSEILSLNKLTDKIKDQIRDNQEFSRSQLLEVAKGKDDKEKNKLFKALLKDNSSRDQLRAKRTRAVEATLKTMINGLTAKLNEIDLNSLPAENGNDIKGQLLALAKLIGEKAN